MCNQAATVIQHDPHDRVTVTWMVDIENEGDMREKFISYTFKPAYVFRQVEVPRRRPSLFQKIH